MIVICFLLLFVGQLMSQQWTREITNDINQLRKEYKLDPIVYNYTLHDELIRITESTWPGMWYEWDTNYCMKFPFNRTNCNKGYSLNPLGSYALCHDTIKFPNKIKLIISQRIAQKKCLATRCSGENWISCFKDPSYENLFGSTKSKCLFGHHYLVKFLLKDLKYISCVTLKYLTGYSPIKQNYSFWCYSNSEWSSQKSDLIGLGKD